MISDFVHPQQYASTVSAMTMPPAIVSTVDPNLFYNVDDEHLEDLNNLLAASGQTTTSSNLPVLSDFTEWDKQLERKFHDLAEKKALNQLGLGGKLEFEKLQILRRQLKNPRTGEEVLIEYEQGKLTRELVTALTKYVDFHKSSHQPRQRTKEEIH